MTVRIKLDNVEIEIKAVRPYSGPSPIESPFGGGGTDSRAVLLVLNHGQAIDSPEGKRLSYNGGGFLIGTAILTMDGLYVSE